MLCVVAEETERVIGERRLATLRELAADAGAATTERDLFAAVDASLSTNRFDLPFAFAYTIGEDGRPEGASADAPGWADAELLASAPAVVELAGRSGIPAGGWEDPPRQALVLELIDPARPGPAGLLIAGLNPYRGFDGAYRGFLGLVAGQIASSLGSVRARQADRERAEALAELDRAKTDFFSNVSHEFRTPLSLILGPAEDALAEAEDDEQGERLNVVFRNALRLQKLVNNLLEFSRIEAGSAEPMREPTDLAAFTADLASMFRAATDRAGIALVVERPDGPVIARVDREMWERIVLNLVSNAFKFTFEGEIRVTLRRDGADAVLVVADTGAGIAADDLASLFERFKRVRGVRSRTHEGSGIGLALVQELARLHGGTVAGRERARRGLDVHGPRAARGRRAGRRGRPRRAAPPPTSRRRCAGCPTRRSRSASWRPSAPGLPAGDGDLAGRARILIADDNADLRDYLERLLARHWDVETVRDGRAALEAVRERRPDLILSDAMMPELDGFGLLAELRADPARRSCR